MTTKKRKLVYALTVLLFLCLLGAVSWLAYVLFSFRMSPLPDVAAGRSPGPRHTPESGPVSETVIDAGAPADGDPEKQGAEEHTAAVKNAGNRSIPCVCEGQDQELRSRKAFLQPLTHQSTVSPTHITVTLNVQPDATAAAADKP